MHFQKTAKTPTIPQFIDNTAELSLANQKGRNARTKHIEVNQHHISQLQNNGILTLLISRRATKSRTFYRNQ